MPSTRSSTSNTEKSTENSTRNSEETSRDWSMNTPSDSAPASSNSGPITSRSPLSSIPEQINTENAENQLDQFNPAFRDGSQPMLQDLDKRVAVQPRDYGRIPAPLRINPQQPLIINKSTRDIEAQSHSSHKKREEAQARMTLALRELEVAEARSRLAQAELELVTAESEEECILEETSEERTQEVENWCTQASIEPNKNEKPEGKTSDIQQLAQVIMKLSEKSRDVTSPKYIELPQFGGSCEEWLAFKRTYEDTAASFSDAQNLARFRRAIQGRARQAVQSLLFTANDPRDIISGLEARFGRPGALALAELEKMKNIPRVSENPGDICVFASVVRNAVETIKALKKPQYLSSPETTKAVVDKMPSSMKFRWYAYHRNRRDEGCQELELIEAFLGIEADMCGDFAPPEDLSESKRGTRRPVHTVQGAANEYKKICPHCEKDHFITECYKFRDADIEKKWEIIKRAKVCFKCLKFKHSRSLCKAPVCKKCGRWHHSILHSDKSPPATSETKSNAAEEKVASVHTTKGDEKAYLKMVPVDLYGPNGHARVLALLDEGSTVTLLDAAIANKIGAEGDTEALSIETVGGKTITKEGSQRITIKIKGAFRKDRKDIIARTIDDLKLSEQKITIETVRSCPHLRVIGKQLLYANERPKLLIGQDNWGLIVTRRLKKGKPAEPVASLTNLGWVLHGYEAGIRGTVNFVNYANLNDGGLEGMVKEHFQLESLGIQDRSPTYDSDRRALEILRDTTKRLPSGQYEAGLLWRKDNEILPNNYKQALRRLHNIERKIDKDIHMKINYENQINGLIQNGYAEKAPIVTTANRTFYLPHFAVEHPLKKKLRIVFDAAAKYEGKSLNDALLAGPDLLQSLFGVLLRFREGPVAIMADIQDMFLRVKVRDDDRDSLRFLWRGDRREGKPEEYRMSSIIFGAASSPATAIYVMNKNAERYTNKYPDAVKAIGQNHYMDDYLQSFTSPSEAINISKQVKEIHAEASLHLKGWASNVPSVLATVADASQKESIQLTKEEKTLGLRWLVKEDSLAFNVGYRNLNKEITEGNKIPTKREVTSAVMSTFDPMGFATPVLIQGKKLIQNIWRLKIDWDETIGEELHHHWKKYLNEVSTLSSLRVPRCISPRAGKGELHTFTDASEEAYAAITYWRVVEPNGHVHISMIAGKARVTPTKPVSIPRLELQAALLGSRLTATIVKEMGLEVCATTYWTDSSTVLQWIQAEPRKFNTFVANRLAEIEERTKPEQWRWVPTKSNPADDATRGTPVEFNHNARWFQGPAFLYQPEQEWPHRSFTIEKLLPELKLKQVACNTISKQESIIKLEKYSNWSKLLRTTARVFHFCDVIRNKRQFTPLEARHITHAENYLLKISQHTSFYKEIKSLQENQLIEKSSPLRKIDVFLQNDNLLKLRSRTAKYIEETHEREMNPVILSGKERITRLIIQYYHVKFCHGNMAIIMNELRKKYWIIGLRAAIKFVSHNCQWCKLRKSPPEVPPMGDLPSERLQHHRYPFTCTAVDYFGPMQVTIGRRTEKRWGALFTCLTTRAIHLELVPSLSTGSMIMALRRLSARRGTPKVMFSDNGTNFVGANHELRDAALEKGITWKFIPPGSPNMGGAWERLVRSVKTSLMAVLNEKHPPEEVLYTLLTEVEHIVNSRPLTPISMDPEDEESLTPNHFLIGRSCGSMAPGEFSDRDLIGRVSWKTTQRLADHFWQRWVKEYLPILMPRHIDGRSNTDPQEGDIVLIVDATLPRNSWPRGEVIKTYPGPDGRNRVLDIRTAGGILRRATRRVIVLVPVNPPQPRDVVLRTAGEAVSDGSIQE